MSYLRLQQILSHISSVIKHFCALRQPFQAQYSLAYINPLQTKRRPLYLKTQSVPRCKHF